MEVLSSESRISVNEYFQREEVSECRQEYIDGITRELEGDSVGHNEIAGNLYLALR